MEKNLANQKEEERWYFEYFQKCYGQLFFEPNPDHIGKPDFIVNIDGKIIGVELTEYSNQKVMENISLREKARDLSEEKFKQLLTDDSHQYTGIINIDYKHDIFTDKKKKLRTTDALAKNIASMVYHNIEDLQDHDDHYRIWKLLKRHNLEDSLDGIWFQSDIGGPTLFWNCTYNAFRAGNLGYQKTIDGIRRVVKKKERKLNEYLRICDECWLLIHHIVHTSLVDFDGHTQEIEETYRNLLKDSHFSKIVFMTTGERHQLIWFKNN